MGRVGANAQVGSEFNSNKGVSWDGYSSNFCEPQMKKLCTYWDI